jgi:hypothetical protein
LPHRWRELGEQAANEEDDEKLIELVKEINELLETESQRLVKGAEES